MVNLNNFEHSPALAELTVSFKRERSAECHQEVKPPVLTTYKLCEQYLRSIWDKDTIELRQEFIVICMNDFLEVIGWVKLHTGQVNHVTFDPKLVLAVALQTMSSIIIVAHNRPSGVAEPEPDTKPFTLKLAYVCKLLGLLLLDHMIIGRDGCYSYATAGELDDV